MNVYNNQPELRTVLLEMLQEYLFTKAKQRYAKRLDHLYTLQARHYPNHGVGFRYQGEVYSLEPMAEERPSRYARLHESLVPEFASLIRQYNNWRTNQDTITSCLASALLRARNFKDTLLLVPDVLHNALPHRLTVRANQEPTISQEDVLAFQTEYSTEIQMIKEQLVLNVLDA